MGSASETLFQYDRTLDSRNIRLLRLLPGKGSKQIHCRLYERTLHYKLHYKALSYVWGDPSETRNIYCNDKVFQVTSNLFNALWQLRENGSYGYLWIDAICINQSNVEEKTDQMRMMMNIYKQADVVIIWLGEQLETDQVAIDLAKQIYNAAQTFDIEGCDMLDVDSEAGLPPVWTRSWAALWSLLDRPWFSRVWVWQELIFAKACTMLCGSLHLDPEMLLDVAYIVRNAQTSARPTIATVTGVLGLAKGGYPKGQLLHLTGLMLFTRALQASDPRDKVFALVGIASDVSCDFIDYEKSVAELHTGIIKKSLTETWIEGHGLGLNVLSFVNGLPSEPSLRALPSWVPALSNIDPYFIPLVYSFTNACEKSEAQSDLHFDHNVGLLFFLDASDGISSNDFLHHDNSVPYFRLTGSMQTLDVLGRVIDLVDTTIDQTPETTRGETFPLIADDRIRSDQKLLSWLMVCKEVVLSLQPYPTEENSKEIFWRTLIFDTADTGGIAPASYGESFDVFMKLTLSVARTPRIIPRPPSHFLKYSEASYAEPCKDQDNVLPTTEDDDYYIRARAKETERHMPTLKPFEQAFGRFVRGRKFFSSKRGFVGWIPISAQTGDKICILQGCGIPYVIRPGERGYILLGDCYIHGLMHGEAIRLEHAPLERIRLT